METKDHQKAINGFIVWVLTWVGLFMFVVWSALDEDLLHEVQFTYYPDKYWAIALPAIFVMLFAYFLTTYFLMSIRNTKSLNDAYCVTDDDAKPQGKAGLGTLSSEASSSKNNCSVPSIADIPVDVTSRLLHQPWK
jgi:phosphatidylinositol glycan class P protein